MKRMGAISVSHGFFLCLSASLLVLGTYLQTVEIPVRITSDLSAAEQTDLMHVFWPLSFAFWILSFVFFGYSLVLRHRKSSSVQLEKPLLSRSLVAAIALGVLALVSTFLPWAVVSAVRSGQSISLSGVDLIGSNYWAGDVMYLVFVSSVIAILYIPLLTLFERQKTCAIRVFLLLLSGVCIVYPILSVSATESWFYSISFLGGLLAKFENPGIGLLIAAFSAAGLIVLGVADTVKSIRQKRTSFEELRTSDGYSRSI
ncbi:MAG: hypothetical protein QXZ70_05675 [Candidatus Bathyarchaeia archaeon]